MRVDLRTIAQAANDDPRKALLDRVGPMTEYQVFHNRVMVATHIPSEKIGSIIMPDRSMAEARFQGKVGLILKKGPLAFQDQPPSIMFGGVNPDVGDWVFYRPSDAVEMFIKDRLGAVNDGISVRVIEDALIMGAVDDPALIY